MTDVVGSDIPQGQEVKWYAGGVAYTQTVSTPTTAAITLTKTADFGSVIAEVDGVAVDVTEFQSNGTDPATEATGTAKIVLSTGGTTGTLYYVDTQTTGLTHIASCQDVKCDSNASVKTQAVHGQPTKLNVVGALENTAEMEELYYTQTFVKAVMGDQITNSPASGKEKWTNKITGARKVGALVGKRSDSSGNIIYKIFLMGAQATGISGTFPTEDFYKRSMKFQIDYWTECSIPAS